VARSGDHGAIGSLALPGDELIVDASMVFDHAAVYRASPEEIWPWVAQLGKWRGGWYMPRRVERLVVWSKRRRAATVVDDRWQHLSVGDRVPDYGGREEEFEVVVVEPPRALVYRSRRRRAVFTWALVLTRLDDGQTRLHTRFRGRIVSTGLRRRALVRLGAFADWASISLMFAGLRERLATASPEARSRRDGD
jgi:hypothetical protein